MSFNEIISGFNDCNKEILSLEFELVQPLMSQCAKDRQKGSTELTGWVAPPQRPLPGATGGPPQASA